MKNAQVRCLNNMVDMSPLLQHIEIRTPDLYINLENVTACNGPGVNIFISMLLKGGLKKFSNLRYKIKFPNDRIIAKRIGQLGIERIFNYHGLECDERENLLPFCLNVTSNNNVYYEERHPSGEVEHDELIFVPKANEAERDSVLRNIRTQVKKFLNRDHAKSFIHEQIALVIMEMVKNTLDHSNSSASLGLHFNLSPRTGKRFAFSYCEQGLGIVLNLRKHVSFGTRQRKAGVGDLLHWALTPGNSTKFGNGINYGLGTMIIMNGAKFGGMRLHMWDGKSIVKLDEFLNSLTHENIRTKMVPSSNSDLFMFFGEMEGEP